MSLITLASPGAIALQFGPCALPNGAHFGPIVIRYYGIMIAFGFLTATWFATRLAKKRSIDADKLLNGALLCFIGGIIGARLYFVALSWPSFVGHPEEILATWLGGLSIHGGIVGAVIVGWIYCKVSKLDFLPALDVCASVVPLAQAIGRWGNFFNSEAFGKPVPDDFPIRLFIPSASRPAGYENSNYFHATFLYESIWNLCIFLLLYFFLSERLRRWPGMTFLAYLFLYSIGRFLIEPLRLDSIMVSGMAAPEVVSAAIIIGSALAMIALWFKHKPTKSSE